MTVPPEITRRSRLVRVIATTLTSLVLVALSGLVAQPANATPNPTSDPMIIDFAIPTDGATVYLPIDDFYGNVDWGDGTWNQDTGAPPYAGDPTRTPGHAYAGNTEETLVTVKIYGTATHFGAYSWPGQGIALAVESWGDLGPNFTSLEYAFAGAERLNDVPATIPATVTNLNSAFIYAARLNDAELASWDTSNVTTMLETFAYCENLDVDLSNWDVSHVTNFSGMFYGASIFNQNLSNWDVSAGTNFSGMFGEASAFNQPLNSWNMSQASDIGWMFDGASAFNQPLNLWNVSNVQNLEATFEGATSFNQNINSWNTSAVTSLDYTFNGASSFDQSLYNWNVSNVTRMDQTFNGASSFNRDLSTWDVSHVTTMMWTFADTAAFDTNLNTWDVSHVTNMTGMFKGSLFNQSLSNWNTSAVTDMGRMFNENTTFNRDLSSWNTGSLVRAWSMFEGATSFNQPLNSWDVSHVTNMEQMFHGATSFNQPLGAWNVSHVTNMGGMFEVARAFNQNLSSWDTSSLTTARWMFHAASSYNQPMSTWDTSHLTSLWGMFGDCTAFDQDLSSWDLSHITNVNYTFHLSGMSALNYSKFIRKLATGAHEPNGLIEAVGVHYLNTASSFRTTLANDGWVILDDGSVSAPLPIVTTSPTASAITLNQALSASSLSGGTASVPGTFAFTTPSITPAAGVNNVSVTFTPTDSLTYGTTTTTASVTVNASPARTVAPVITGTAAKNKYLTASVGTWRGFPTPTITRQWYRCMKAVAAGLAAIPSSAKCTAIRGATASRYKVVAADVGKYVTVVVTATNRLGAAKSTAKSTAKVK